MHSMTLKLLVPAVAIMIGSRSVQAQVYQPEYTITDVGVFSSGIDPRSLDVNGAGQVCGWGFTRFYDSYAFYWDDGNLEQIRTFWNFSRAYGINDAGTVVGTAMQPFYTWHTGFEPRYVDMPAALTTPWDINEQGVVAGDYLTDWTYGVKVAFFYADGVVTELGTFGGDNASATGVNELNHVVGWAEAANGQPHIFLYAEGVMNDLGVYPGSSSSAPTSINELDQVAGYQGQEPGSRAFILDVPSMRWTNLGYLPGGSSSAAYGIDDRGVVVGRSTIGGGADHAFIWDTLHGMRDLNDLVPSGSGWELQSANAVHSSGMIVGTGRFNAVTHAFLLVPIASVDCSRIHKFAANCRADKLVLKAKLRTTLSTGTLLTLFLDAGDPLTVTVAENGKATAKWKHVSSGEHAVCVGECPNICATTTCTP